MKYMYFCQDQSIAFTMDKYMTFLFKNLPKKREVMNMCWLYMIIEHWNAKQFNYDARDTLHTE